MKILVTYCAGFIGFHVARELLKRGLKVVGMDSINNYYDIRIKQDRIKILKKYSKNFFFIKGDMSMLQTCFKSIQKI